MPPGWLARASHPDRNRTDEGGSFLLFIPWRGGAERGAGRPTRTSRADSILAIPVRDEPLELGRSGRTSALVQDLDRGVGDSRFQLLADQA